MSAVNGNPGLDSIEDLFVNHGVTNDGFKRPHLDLIWEVAVAEAERVFGRRLTAPTSAELQYVETIVLWTDTYFETAEANYYAAYYRTAQGKQLDRLLALMGFDRIPERQASGVVTFYAARESGATNDVAIPAGTRVTTSRNIDSDRIFFQTTEAVTIPEGQSKVEEVSVVGLDPLLTNLDLSDAQTGVATNVAQGAIDVVYDTVQGVGGVTNQYPTGSSGEFPNGEPYNFATGRERETDVEFRRRYENAQALGGAATIPALESGIKNAGDGTVVEAVRVDETLDITQDADGDYHGRQVEPIVVLSEDTTANRQAVGQAIFETRAGGIESVGDVQVFAERTDGSTHNRAEGFDIATEQQIYIEADILVSETFPNDGIQQIKRNLVEMIGGRTRNDDRVLGEYEAIGADVYYSAVVGAIMDNDITGIIDIDGTTFSDAIFMGTSDPPTGTSNVTISRSEVGVTRPEQITINTTVSQPQ